MSSQHQVAVAVLALKLPFEITSKIFLSCIPPHGRIRPRHMQAPLLLAQICGHWRDIALATPELWSSIYLMFPTDNDITRIFATGIGALDEPDVAPLHHHSCNLLESWLHRSGNRPLSITIVYRRYLYSRLPQKLISTLARYAHRWCRLELSFAKEEFLAFNEIQGPFPLLRSIAICLADWHNDFVPEPFNVLRDSPNLEPINLENGFSPLTLTDLEGIPDSLSALQCIKLEAMLRCRSFFKFLIVFHASSISILHRRSFCFF
ncbi:hypothetical protein C8R43DRAFT_1064331 [Mycena crocata]|nr:hypothetical protein C8R43DRAFT_1064331 [Mycena crocata]